MKFAKYGVMAVAALAVAVPVAYVAAKENPEVLWNLVQQCEAHRQSGAAPAPCVSLEPTQGGVPGVAVLKDRTGIAQYLVMPSDKVTGIEDPQVLAPGAAYWQAAWQARRLMDRHFTMPVPRHAVSLAVNSRYGRSQNQLHIHVSCTRPEVIREVSAAAKPVDGLWHDFPVVLAGKRYKVQWLAGDELGARDPFRLLAEGLAVKDVDMGRHTLVLLGLDDVNGQPGFALLEDEVDRTLLDRASGEVLQDHDCAVMASTDRR